MLSFKQHVKVLKRAAAIAKDDLHGTAIDAVANWNQPDIIDDKVSTTRKMYLKMAAKSIPDSYKKARKQSITVGKDAQGRRTYKFNEIRYLADLVIESRLNRTDQINEGARFNALKAAIRSNLAGRHIDYTVAADQSETIGGLAAGLAGAAAYHLRDVYKAYKEKHGRHKVVAKVSQPVATKAVPTSVINLPKSS